MERNEVLIVDDNGNTRKHIAWAVEDTNSSYEINHFDNADSAYNYFEENHQRVKTIVTDENMTGMKGTEFIRKGYALDSNVNFISMSGGEPGKVSGKEIEEIALNAGAKAFLEKPFSFDDLMNTLEKYL